MWGGNWCELDTYLDANTGVSPFYFEDDSQIDDFIFYLHNYYSIEISKEELQSEDQSIVYLFDLIRQRCNKDDLTILRAVIGSYYIKAHTIALQEQNRKKLILQLLTSLIEHITTVQSQLLHMQDEKEISLPALCDCLNDWLIGLNQLQRCVVPDVPDTNDDEDETSSADEDPETESSENIETENSESENVE